MKKNKWVVNSFDEKTAYELSEQVGISLLAAKTAVSRGVLDAYTLRTYISTSVDYLNDPYLFEDMAVAVDTIKRYVAENRKIAVFGDYDVDGITATYVLMSYIKSIGGDCTYYIPDRFSEGYGVSTEAVKRLAELGVELIITVDTGITADAEVLFARTLGIEFIITDHHECKDTLPDALAVINPKRPGSTYPFKELAGVGVAFKLVCALHGDTDEMLSKYADFVALGTVADVMPLVGENRAIVNYGIENIADTQNPGLSSLLFRSGVIGKDKRKPTSSSISFILAPRINAAGRFATADIAVELFMCEDIMRADELANTLIQLNTDRQKFESAIMKQVDEKLADFSIKDHRAIVLWHENWHQGVIGIVASKLVDKYFCPVILLSLDDGIAKGSGRSIKGFNLFKTLTDGNDYLVRFGGHELAAGLTLKEENLDEFYEYFLNCADSTLAPEDCVPHIYVDCEVDVQDFTLNAVSDLALFEPYGMGNAQPLYLLSDVQITRIASIGNDKHVKFILTKDQIALESIWFGMCINEFPYTDGDVVDVVFSAEINTFRGKSVQLIVKDMHYCTKEEDSDRRFQKMYDDFMSGISLNEDEISLVRPCRDDLVAVWRYIRSNAKDNTISMPLETMYRRIKYQSNRDMNLCKLHIALNVFEEFNLISLRAYDGSIEIFVNETTGKVDISGAEILQRLQCK